MPDMKAPRNQRRASATPAASLAPTAAKNLRPLKASQTFFDSIAFQQVRIAGTQTAWSVCARLSVFPEYCL
ncbi:hypothetical protein HWD95_10945 [Pseudomonas corrugata]|nr:hypothetical protein [Pseudomonas corrugata]